MATGVAGETGSPGAAENGGEVSGSARAGEPDRYLAALLAPPPQRDALVALAAFSTELSRIPLRVVREPLMAQLRLEWWRAAIADATDGEGKGAGHAVADAMRAAIRKFRLPAALLDNLIDAHALLLSDQPFLNAAAVDDFLWQAEGALFALSAGVMGAETDGDDVGAASAAAGRAYGGVRLLQSLPRSLSLGRIPVAANELVAAGLNQHELLAGTAPSDKAAALLRAHFAQIRGNLAEARRLVRRLPRATRLAFLPLALVEPYVRVLERQGGGALRAEAQVLPFARVWRIATAHLLGRL
ncbi:MAG TPA: squalene/phytoene synthase family protein [Hyphomicrobiaceae bacterium]|nr:squalene/phytoene synthase family protein [Hyphomicrobiaceae bacterium]